MKDASKGEEKTIELTGSGRDVGYEGNSGISGYLSIRGRDPKTNPRNGVRELSLKERCVEPSSSAHKQPFLERTLYLKDSTELTIKSYAGHLKLRENFFSSLSRDREPNYLIISRRRSSCCSDHGSIVFSGDSRQVSVFLKSEN